MVSAVEVQDSAAVGIEANPFHEAMRLVVRARHLAEPASDRAGVDEHELAGAFDELLEWLEKGSRLWLENS